MRRSKAVFVCTQPVGNVPPFHNVPAEFVDAGARVWVIGYHAGGLPRFERVRKNHLIIRLRLRSRSIRWPVIGKALALVEFLVAAKRLVSRIDPDTVVVFNDPGALLFRMLRGHAARKIAWLLEYPEFERFGFAERLICRASAREWEKTDMVVTPTVQRLALHLGLRPRCIEKPCVVVHNTPRSGEAVIAATSPASMEARAVLLRAREQGRVSVVYAGAVGNRYAVNKLIQAAARGQDRMHLLLLGQKHDLSIREVTGALEVAGRPSNVTWIDEVPYRELASVLSAADAGFATYMGDTLNTYFSAPGKIYDYLRAGLIIVSDQDCCIRDQLLASGAGVLFPRPVTTEGIAAALAALVEAGPDKIARMKQSALSLFRTSFHLASQLAPVLKIHFRQDAGSSADGPGGRSASVARGN